MTTQTLNRVFKLGVMRLPDPDPSWTVDRVRDHYTPNYPSLATASVGEPVVAANDLVFTFTQAEAKTKG
ncbi:MAG: PRTRC system protein C [Rhizobium sp.]|nr:MAG: PRTRC system protein C [Rhizobium sp.]